MRQLGTAGLIGFGLALAVAAVPQAAELNYKDKLVTLISGSAAGGTVDAMARTVAQFVPKYVPGAPKAAVQNVPGAGQLRGAQTAAKAKPDGLTIGIFSPRWMTDYLLAKPVEGIDFDQIKQHYYVVHEDINPTGIVPKGPDESGWHAPHGRERLGSPQARRSA